MRSTIREKLERCTSLPTLPAAAVQIVGTNAVRTLVLSFSLARDHKTSANAKLSGYWRRSLLSAVAARQLAPLCGVNADEAFLAGLLQDLGMLALWRALGTEYGPILEQSQADHDCLAALETEAFGADHAEVGAWLLGGDFVGRYGGEEFVIIVRADSAAEVSAVAERILRNIADQPHPVGNGCAVAVTISLGSALLDATRHNSAAALLGEADGALYSARRAGRNRHIASTGATARETPSHAYAHVGE